MEVVNWGIIGAGDVCEKKSGPAFYKIEHSRLVAIMRRDEQKAKDFALRHHVERYYTSADDLINDPDINMIYVATPPSSHKEYAIRALAAGKPVYVEKPMAMNYGECLEMLQASEKAGQKLFVAYYRRALPYFLKVKEIIDKGMIGKPLTLDMRYFRPVDSKDKAFETQLWRVKKEIAGDGYFFDLAPHTLDILDFLLGEISDAKGFCKNMGGYYEASDTISAIVQFKSGVTGTGQWCFVSCETERQDIVTILGTEGSVSFNTFAFNPIELTTEKGIEYIETEQPEHIQQPLIQTIVDELRGIGKCPSTAISGARTSRIMDLIVGNLS